jgi:hypothetical protein
MVYKSRYKIITKETNSENVGFEVEEDDVVLDCDAV